MLPIAAVSTRSSTNPTTEPNPKTTSPQEAVPVPTKGAAPAGSPEVKAWQPPVTPILAPAPTAPSSTKKSGLQLEQLSWDKIKQIPQAGFFVPGDNPVGLMVEQHTYKSTDPLIHNDIHRHATSERLEKSGIQPNWTKCTGVVELGANPNIGLLNFSTVGVSTGFNGLVQYRSLKPYPTPSTPGAARPKNISKLELPTTAEAALKLPQGSEVEFSGQGSFEGGVDFGVQVGGSLSQEVKLSIKRLDGDYVRVDFGDIKGISPNITADFTPLSLMDNPLGAIGEGLILTAVRCGATAHLTTLVRIVKNANLKAQLSYAQG